MQNQPGWITELEVSGSGWGCCWKKNTKQAKTIHNIANIVIDLESAEVGVWQGHFTVKHCESKGTGVICTIGCWGIWLLLFLRHVLFANLCEEIRYLFCFFFGLGKKQKRRRKKLVETARLWLIMVMCCTAMQPPPPYSSSTPCIVTTHCVSSEMQSPPPSPLHCLRFSWLDCRKQVFIWLHLPEIAAVFSRSALVGAVSEPPSEMFLGFYQTLAVFPSCIIGLISTQTWMSELKREAFIVMINFWCVVARFTI